MLEMQEEDQCFIDNKLIIDLFSLFHAIEHPENELIFNIKMCFTPFINMNIHLYIGYQFLVFFNAIQ